jgi:ABC-2 type transport system permease protein
VSSTTYLRYEAIRTLRNRRFFIFSLGFPVVLYLVIAGPNRHQKLGGIPFALYFMTGMVAWGTMAAVMAGGARIALERQVGWHRQLRITPLTTRAYFGAKVATGYGMAAVSIALLFTLGASFGVRLSAGAWLTMTGLILVGLIPFAILGILLGHLLTADSMGPAMGGITSLLALLGGAYGPVASTGVMLTIVKGLPSYWLVQAGKSALTGHSWPASAWIVVAVWSLVLLRLTAYVYQRDTARA